METTLLLARSLAGAITLLWVAWWAFFVGAVILNEGMPPARILLVVMLALLTGLASVILIRGREGVAGSLLTAEGIVLLILSVTLFQSQPFVIAALALPPLVAGGLLLIWRFTFAHG